MDFARRVTIVRIATDVEFLTLTEPRGVARVDTGHDHVSQGVHDGPPFLLWSESESAWVAGSVPLGFPPTRSPGQ